MERMWFDICQDDKSPYLVQSVISNLLQEIIQ